MSRRQPLVQSEAEEYATEARLAGRQAAGLIADGESADYCRALIASNADLMASIYGRSMAEFLEIAGAILEAAITGGAA